MDEQSAEFVAALEEFSAAAGRAADSLALIGLEWLTDWDEDSADD